jgi:endonuclease/exonuclease/phosphatase family metal-dependent hydrolase
MVHRAVRMPETDPVVSTLRVITYNIRKGKGAHGRAAVEIAALGRALSQHDADLVLCQEVFHSSRTGASQSGHLAQAMGLSSYYGANKFRAVGHHGNTTLTRLKVESFVNHDISTNRIERRGALYVRLDLDGRTLHVFNVHLGLNGWQRQSQVKQIATLMAEACPACDPLLLAGDFNDWRHDLDRFIVGELGLANAFADHEPSAIRTWHARRPMFALDRMYVRNLRVRQAGRLHGEPWSELSDHLPLYAELQLPR